MERKYVQAAEVHRALGNPVRVRMIEILRDGEMSRKDLLLKAKVPEPVFAQHLARLCHLGLLKTKRDGRRMYYAISDPGILKLCDAASDIYRRSYDR